jgi:hypothetical protein
VTAHVGALGHRPIPKCEVSTQRTVVPPVVRESLTMFAHWPEQQALSGHGQGLKRPTQAAVTLRMARLVLQSSVVVPHSHYTLRVPRHLYTMRMAACMMTVTVGGEHTDSPIQSLYRAGFHARFALSHLIHAW